jgi:hypothetical protein
MGPSVPYCCCRRRLCDPCYLHRRGSCRRTPAVKQFTSFRTCIKVSLHLFISKYHEIHGHDVTLCYASKAFTHACFTTRELALRARLISVVNVHKDIPGSSGIAVCPFGWLPSHHLRAHDVPFYRNKKAVRRCESLSSNVCTHRKKSSEYHLALCTQRRCL